MFISKINNIVVTRQKNKQQVLTISSVKMIINIYISAHINMLQYRFSSTIYKMLLKVSYANGKNKQKRSETSTHKILFIDVFDYFFINHILSVYTVHINYYIYL